MSKSVKPFIQDRDEFYFCDRPTQWELPMLKLDPRWQWRTVADPWVTTTLTTNAPF